MNIVCQFNLQLVYIAVSTHTHIHAAKAASDGCRDIAGIGAASACILKDVRRSTFDDLNRLTNEVDWGRD
jgi:hypothetical protein